MTAIGLSQASKVALSVVFVVSLLIIGLAVEYWMITRTIEHSNSQWCDTLNLLTKTPVPKPANPKANPSREGSYLFYTNLVALKDKFGCQVTGG